MDKGSLYAEHASKEVTIVISRKIKPGCEKQYDDWLRRYLMLEKKVPGYVGATIITQGGTDSAIRHLIYSHTIVHHKFTTVRPTLGDPNLLLGSDVHGATMGIFGLGRIGSAVARRAKGFDMHIIYHTRHGLLSNVLLSGRYQFIYSNSNALNPLRFHLG